MAEVPKPRSFERFYTEDKGKAVEAFGQAKRRFTPLERPPANGRGEETERHDLTPERGLNPPRSWRGATDRGVWRMRQDRLDAASREARAQAVDEIKAREAGGRVRERER